MKMKILKKTKVCEDHSNTDDAHISQSSVKGDFNTESGLWEYHAVSKDKPMGMMDPCLINSIQERNDVTRTSKLNIDTGLYSIHNIQPSTVNEDGSQKKCSCGKVYHRDGIFKANGRLYTRMGPVNI